jgi:hypothetical protein
LPHRSLAVLVISLVESLSAPPPALAIVHLWDIAEIYSNDDGSVQFVELFTKGAGEVAIQTGRLRSDANDVDLVGPVLAPTTSRSFLIATPGFADLPGGVTPDTTMPAGPFFEVDGDTLVFTTLNNAPIFDTIIFGPGELPLDGVLSLHRDNPGGTSGADLPGGLFPDDNSPTNYAGDAGHLMLPEPATTLLGAIALVAVSAAARRTTRDASSGSASAVRARGRRREGVARNAKAPCPAR